jgi:hypothetical protein
MRNAVGPVIKQTLTGVRATRRKDEHLSAMLDDAGEWSVNDKRGRTLYRAASLRDAVTEAMIYHAASQDVIKVCQQPNDVVVVHRAQTRRIAILIGVA